MAHFIAFLLAVLGGVASFYELTEFNKTSSEGKVPPIAAGVGGFLVSLLIAFIAPGLVLGVLIGLVCLHEVQIYERQAKERLLGQQTMVWAGAAGFLAFIGGALVPFVTWLVVCAFAAFAGAFFLLFQEKERLAQENRIWTSENQRLLLERGARGLSEASSAASAPPATAPIASALGTTVPAPAPAPAPAAPRPGAVRKPAGWGATAQPGSGGTFGQPLRPDGNLLPRRPR
jgi:hypothetical protein